MSTDTMSTGTRTTVRPTHADRYEQAMRQGASTYADVTAALAAEGIHAHFTQTGGMCAAIEAVLDGGATLLVTDDEDTLSWDRDEHAGWCAVLWAPGYEDDGSAPLGESHTPDGAVPALLDAVRDVLAQAARRTRS